MYARHISQAHDYHKSKWCDVDDVSEHGAQTHRFLPISLLRAEVPKNLHNRKGRKWDR